MFFFEKKNQKTFVTLCACWATGTRASRESLFASFSSEKKESLPSSPRLPRAVMN
jgi:hypothetical protein